MAAGMASGLFAGAGPTPVGASAYRALAFSPHLRAVTAAPPLRAPPSAQGVLGGVPARRAAPDRSAAAAAHTKAAAPTARTLAPAQHDPGLKALVPASVRIQREKQAPPPSKRARTVGAVGAEAGGGAHPARPGAPRAKPAAPRADDASYLEFLDAARDLGAFD